MSDSQVFLKRRSTGEIVEARLMDSISQKSLDDIEREWLPQLREGLRRLAASGAPRSSLPQSAHWNWSAKVNALRGLLAYRGFAIECEGLTQGLMIVKTTESCRSSEQQGKPLVYVDYLESAPWNQAKLVEQPRFGGVGIVMLAAAVNLSIEEGFHGRIGLHSLPQSDAFYITCGMRDLGRDPAKQNLRYFEMTSDKAGLFLEK